MCMLTLPSADKGISEALRMIEGYDEDPPLPAKRHYQSHRESPEIDTPWLLKLGLLAVDQGFMFILMKSDSPGPFPALCFCDPLRFG
jgi:hypothetical protein